MKHMIRRAVVTGAITAIGAVGLASPASAEEVPLSCDAAVLTAALDAAKADARVAQQAFTSYNSTSMKALAKQVKAEEQREAKAADRKADLLAGKADGVQDKAARQEALVAAKAARTLARAEAKEAAQAMRASRAEMRSIIKVNRVQLKAEWTAAKVALEELEAYAEACAQTPVEEPVVEEPVVQEPVAEEPAGDPIL